MPLAPAPSRAGAFCLERLRIRKLRPRFRLQNGMRFPVGASNGKCIPESAPGMGHTFRNSPQPETATRNRCSEWDALSESPSGGNCIPFRVFILGHAFRKELRRETASHFEHSIWDTLSARSFVGKPHPILSIQSGTWFPRVLPTGKRVPVWQADGHKLSSSYRSTSLSHAGRAVCRMPAVCSFLASIPAERTSFMVKRSRG